MRVLLISSNREKAPFAVAPIGAACLIPPLEADGHTVELLDLCFARRPVRQAVNTVRRFRPDIIGISIRNLDNCMYSSPRSYYQEARLLVGRLKQVVDCCKRWSIQD